MSKKHIPVDVLQSVGGFILGSEYRNKVAIDFQYELADEIARLVVKERKRAVDRLARDARIHRTLADEVCDEEGEKYHLEMADMLDRAALEIGGDA